MKNKITVEITKDGWILKAFVNGNEFTEKGVITDIGATHKGDDLDNMEWVSDELYDALNSFFCYDVADVLREYDEHA